jgi:hypothetical protein
MTHSKEIFRTSPKHAMKLIGDTEVAIRAFSIAMKENMGINDDHVGLDMENQNHSALEMVSSPSSHGGNRSR